MQIEALYEAITVVGNVDFTASQTRTGYKTNHKGRMFQLAWLISYQKTVKHEHDNYLTLEKHWSWARLIIFFSGIVAWLLLGHGLLLSVGLFGIFCTLFTLAVFCHQGARAKREFASQVLLIIDESIHKSWSQSTSVHTGERPKDSSNFPVSLVPVLTDGTTWALTTQEHDDLDLYTSPISIFGLLNRTSTKLGARRLCDMVEHLCLSRERILARQACIHWLHEHLVERLQIMAAGVSLRSRGVQLDKFIHMLCQVTPLPYPIVSRVIRLWSWFSVLFSISAIALVLTGEYQWALPFLALLCFNCIISQLMHRRLKVSIAPWANLRPTLINFLSFARCAETHLPIETELKSLQKCFADVARCKEIVSLCKSLNWTTIGGMIHSFLNVLLFYDLHVAEAILSRVLSSRDILLHGLSALADLEALYSLACFAAEQPIACYPTPVRENVLLITAGQHPLIKHEQAVPNNVRLAVDTRMWVISGPNAAGKSTLLRMVGTNVLLAQIGTVAIAQNMTWLPVRLITDLRIRDDLTKEESYFVSEVRQLRRMLLPQKNELPVLGLIDEAFRGTNSCEKTAASLALFEHLLLDSNNLFLVSTHNDVLTRMVAEIPVARNYHFREELEAGEIVFDYRLRPGPAETRTAIRILEREGYPSTLVTRARKLLTTNS